MAETGDSRSIGNRRLLALGGLLVLAALAGCDGTTAEYVVCEVCLDTDDEASSRVDVQLFENGSGRWTTRLESGADDPRQEAEDLANRIRVEDDDRFRPAYRGRVRDPGATVENGTIVLTFLTDDSATRGVFGTLLVDTFDQHEERREDAYSLGTGRLRLTAPDGMAIANTPPGATVTDDGQSVVWTVFTLPPGDHYPPYRSSSEHPLCFWSGSSCWVCSGTVDREP